MNENKNTSGCCFEPISNELKSQLEFAEKQINDLTIRNTTLSQELELKIKEIEKLRFDKNQILSEKSDLIDHLTIIKAKSDILKSDLKKKIEENEILTKKFSSLEQKNQQMSDLLIKASERIKKNKIQLSGISKQNEKMMNQAIANDKEQTEQFNVQMKMYENVIREQEERIKNLEKKKNELKTIVKEFSKSQETNQRNEQEINSLNSEISQLKIKNQQIEIDNKTLQKQNESIQLILKKYNEIESDNVSLHERTNRLENENKQLQKMLKESNEKFNELSKPKVNSNQFSEQEILILKDKVSQIEEIEKQNKKLYEENKKLSTENKLLELNVSKLSDKIEELNYVALEQEKIKRDVLKCEVEMQEKELKEQSLIKKYHFYKEKAKKQLEIINNFESRASEINNELELLKEREARKEAALRRKNRSQAEIDENAVKLSRELFLEKSKNIRLNSRLQRVQFQNINTNNNI